MNMKRLQIAFALLFVISMGADAQGFLKKLNVYYFTFISKEITV